MVGLRVVVVGGGHLGSLGLAAQFGGQRESVDPGWHTNRVVVVVVLVVVVGTAGHWKTTSEMKEAISAGMLDAAETHLLPDKSKRLRGRSLKQSGPMDMMLFPGKAATSTCRDLAKRLPGSAARSHLARASHFKLG